MNPDFIAQAVASLIGALAGGGIAALIAWRVFRSEAREREADRVEQARRHQVDREAAAKDALQQRRQEAVASIYMDLADLTAALPKDAGTNAPTLAILRLGLSAGALADEMTNEERPGYFAWLNTFSQRYVGLAQAARERRVEVQEVGDLVSAAQGRLSLWIRGVTGASDWLVADRELDAKHQLATPEHPDAALIVPFSRSGTSA